MADWKIIGGITALGGLIGYLGAKTVDSKKLPAGEKAVLTGASTGATMEGLETLMGAESFSALDYELNRNDCCELWVEKLYDSGKIGFGEAGNLLAAIEMDGLKCSQLGGAKCNKKAESHNFSQKSAEGDYEPSFNSLKERIEWMEFAVGDENWYQYEEDYIDVVLDIEEWNENNANNSKLSNLVKQYISRYEDRSFFGAESHNFSQKSAESDDLKLRQRQAWTLTYHDKAENKHKYYMVVSYGDKYYGIFGRLAGYDRAMTIAVTKPMSINEVQNKINEKRFKKGYLRDEKTGAKDWNKMPTASQIKEKIEEKYPSSPSPKSEPKKQQSKPMNRYEKMARRKMGLEAETFEAEKTGKMNLTMKELLVLILVNRDWEGNDWNTDEDGQLSASFYHDDVDMKKMRGVLSSLVKKGVITATEDYVNRHKYTLVSVNDKYTTGVDDLIESINWNMFDCKDEIVSNMGYEEFIEWASTMPESIIRGMAESKRAESFEAERGCYPCPDCGTNMYETTTQYGRFGSIGTHCSCYNCGSNYISKEMNAEDLTAYQWVMQELRDGGSLDTQAYDYLAMTFTPDELEAGAKDSMRRGNKQVASDFVKAINRQNFINEYQTEENR